MTYHSSVQEVRLLFLATEEHNHGIRDLSPSDLVVVDNEVVVRNFSSFQLFKITEVHMLVLVDCSGSVAASFPQEIGTVQRLIATATWIADSSIAVRSFSGNGSLSVCAGDCRGQPLSGLISASHVAGPTPMFDALLLAVTGLPRHLSGTQPVLVLFSDGDDTISIHSSADVIRASLEQDVQIDTVDLNLNGQSRGSQTLRQLAEATGGRYFPRKQDASAIEDALLENLRSAYTLTYKPPNAVAGVHSVQIFPSHNLRLHFRCRRNYYQEKTN